MTRIHQYSLLLYLAGVLMWACKREVTPTEAELITKQAPRGGLQPPLAQQL
jgi:hypothetical protein